MITRIEQQTAPGGAMRTETRSAPQAPATIATEGVPFALRCGAMLIDYTLIAGIIAFATLLAQLFGGGARTAGGKAQVAGYLLACVALLIDFIVLPGISGKTLGKWATGLRIERNDGQPAGFGRLLLRHLVGYPLSIITLGGGFLLAAFSSEGRALHDFVAGTKVVRDAGRVARPVRSTRGK